MRIMPLLITLATTALAGLLGWAMWGVYMGTPWTRDATVRAYVVTMAPEVTGRIVELQVVDNKFVHKGDLLMVIDPTNYSITVSQAEAAVQQAQASMQNVDAQLAVQEAQINASQAVLDQAEAVLVFAKQQATRYQTLAKSGYGTIQNAVTSLTTLLVLGSRTIMLLVFSLLTKMSPVSLAHPAAGAAAMNIATSGPDRRLEMRTGGCSLHQLCGSILAFFPQGHPSRLGLDVARREVLFLDGENLAGLDFDIAD
jgi:hypothetical protein